MFESKRNFLFKVVLQIPFSNLVFVSEVYHLVDLIVHFISLEKHIPYYVSDVALK